MPWLKRNLWLVVGGVVALALLGLAGFFLYSKIQAEADVTGLLETQTTDLDGLLKKDPHPGSGKVDNVDSAKKQDAELKAFLAQARQAFVPLDYPKGLDSGQFKLLLDNTADELQRLAQRAGTKLPAQYYFTFAAQKPLMSFEAATLDPLAMMLTDIRAVCEIIFEGKVLTLDGIRRNSVATQDTPSPTGPSDYWGRKGTTNDLAITTPYEFTFHCFTAELANVLRGLYSSPHFFIVKNVAVDTAPSTLLEKEKADRENAQPLVSPGMSMSQMMMMMRYGNRYRPMPTEPVAPPPTARGGLQAMLDEKPFRVVLWVDVLRLKESKEPKAPKAPKPPRQTADAANPPN